MKIIVKYLSTSLFILLLISACSGNNSPDSSTNSGSVFLEHQTINVAETTRRYHLILPNRPEDASLVFLFHGNTGSSDQILGRDNTKAPYKVWLTIAERENLVLVVPDGAVGSSGKQGWNDCRADIQTNPETDDVAFVSALLDDIQTRYLSNDANIFAVGTSNGGKMVQRLADEVPEKFDAVAVMVTSRPINSACTESDLPLSILFMNGTSDPLVPYEGGQVASDRGEVFSTDETVAYWINRNQTTTTPTIFNVADSALRDDSTITRYSYTNGADQSVVEHYEVVNGGHTEPSIEERYGVIYKLIVGNQNADLEFAEEVWTFFSARVNSN
ncbi:MAG: PHB depolymerase family esterase [Granulosicoccus sp.]